jgi:hypothetical protein
MKEETGKRSVIFCDSAIQNAMATWKQLRTSTATRCVLGITVCCQGNSVGALKNCCLGHEIRNKNTWTTIWEADGHAVGYVHGPLLFEWIRHCLQQQLDVLVQEGYIRRRQVWRCELRCFQYDCWALNYIRKVYGKRRHSSVDFSIVLLQWVPVPGAARSRVYVCGLSPAEMVGSDPTGGIDICMLWVFCVVR